MFEEIKIKNLKCDGGEWTWTEVTADYDGETQETDYRTNGVGEGLWKLEPGNTYTVSPDTGKYKSIYEWKQQTGTGQFSLRGYSISGARKKIARRYS